MEEFENPQRIMVDWDGMMFSCRESNVERELLAVLLCIGATGKHNIVYATNHPGVANDHLGSTFFDPQVAEKVQWIKRDDLSGEQKTVDYLLDDEAKKNIEKHGLTVTGEMITKPKEAAAKLMGIFGITEEELNPYRKVANRIPEMEDFDEEEVYVPKPEAGII